MKYFTNTLTLVLAFLAAGALSAQLSVTPSPAADANTTLTFNLYDTFGDGWNGAVSIGVSGERAVVSGADGNCVPEVSIVPFSESITWSGGNFGCGPGLVDLVVAKNSEITIESFAGGFFTTEPYFTVEDGGNTILEFVNTGAFFNCPQNNGLTGAGVQCSPTSLPCSASVGDNGEVDCPDGAFLPGAVTVYGEDSWGDGWNGAYIEIELFDEMVLQLELLML